MVMIVLKSLDDNSDNNEIALNPEFTKNSYHIGLLIDWLVENKNQYIKIYEREENV